MNKKKRSPRYKPMSESWLHQVIKESNCEENSKSLKRIERLWHRGFSFKDAAYIIRQQISAGDL